MSASEFHDVVNEFFDVQGWSTTATLIKKTTVYDVDTSDTVVTETLYPMQAMPFDYINKFLGASTMNETLIRNGDKQVYLKPSAGVTDIDPSSDKLLLGGKIYNIVTAKEFNPTMTDVLYWELFVRT